MLDWNDLKFVVKAIFYSPFPKSKQNVELSHKAYKGVIALQTQRHITINVSNIDEDTLYNTLEYSGFRWDGFKWIPPNK